MNIETIKEFIKWADNSSLQLSAFTTPWMINDGRLHYLPFESGKWGFVDDIVEGGIMRKDGLVMITTENYGYGEGGDFLVFLESEEILDEH